MLIGIKHRFVFIANSKTASTSIEVSFAPYAEINGSGSPRTKHMGWVECRKEYASLFDNPEYSPETFFRFGVVREPAEWVRSWYNYRNTTSESVASRFRRKMSFEEFWASDDWMKRRDQKSRFCDEDGDCRFDLIIPLERLQDGISKVYQRLGIAEQPLKKENRSKGTISRGDIPAELIDSINAYYGEDYQFWREWERRLDAFDPLSAPRSTAKPVEPVARGLRWRVEDLRSPLVAYSRVQVEEAPDRGPDACRVRGVVLAAQASLGGDWRLALVDCRGLQVIEWQLASPNLAKKYPGIAGAAASRFRQIDAALGEAQTADICLLGREGELVPILRIGPRTTS